MEITTTHLMGRAPVTVLHLKGDLDASTSDAFSAAANQAVAAGAKNILVDLTEVPFLSSAGIRALHGIYTLLHPVGSEQDQADVYQSISAGSYAAPHLKLLRPNRKVEEVIKMAGLDMYLKSYQDEAEALKAF